MKKGREGRRVDEVNRGGKAWKRINEEKMKWRTVR